MSSDRPARLPILCLATAAALAIVGLAPYSFAPFSLAGVAMATPDEAMPEASDSAATRLSQTSWTEYSREARDHVRRGEYDMAERSLSNALDAMPPVDPGGIRRRTLAGHLTQLSDAHARTGDTEDAARVSDLVLEIYEILPSDPPRDVVRHLQRSARADILRGEPALAIAKLDRALRIQIEAVGESDESVAVLRIDLARAFFALGRIDEAEVQLGLALAPIEEQSGAHGRRAAEIHEEIAKLRKAQGRPKDAVAELRLALEIKEPIHGDESLEVANAMRRLATALHEAGNDREAHELLVGSLAMVETLAPDSVFVAFAENDLAWFLADGETPSEALPHARRAVELIETAGVSGAPLGAALDTLAHAQQRSGLRDEAEKSYRRSLEVYGNGLTERSDREATRERLAELLREQDRDQEAEEIITPKAENPSTTPAS